MPNIGYIRVSTDAQSLARQECLMGEIAPVKLFREKLSGKSTDRPALQAMLEYVREGDVLHVESISRLARSTRDFARRFWAGMNTTRARSSSISLRSRRTPAGSSANATLTSSSNTDSNRKTC